MPFRDDELIGNLILMFITGHETTTNVVGNGALTLVRHPAELERLCGTRGNDAAMMHTAVDEILRCEGSVMTIARHTIVP